MSAQPTIPFLPGYSFRDVTKNEFRKSHRLDYNNGYSVTKRDAPITPRQEVEGDLEDLKNRLAELTYRRKTEKIQSAQFVPAHVAFDKVVLKFEAYFRQTVPDSVEQFHTRRVRILYYVEDESIAVIEPPVENSGITQGVLIKRQRLPKNATEFYTAKDFNLATNVTFYGKTFRIINCDKFTERYMSETVGQTLNTPEEPPKDVYLESRNQPIRIPRITERNDKLQKFLANDRKVLRFYCVWDDRASLFGELREFVLHYYLVDDSVEVREVQKVNQGRDPFPILLRKQPLPKNFNQSDSHSPEKYTWRDFKIGAIINVLGRQFLVYDCDDFTRQFYKEHLAVSNNELQPLSVDLEEHVGLPQPQQEFPPYNGFGTEEDSRGSCKNLVPKPPKKDFIKMLENENKVLRFAACMISKNKEDTERRFVISYRLADDMMTIYEPPQRNAGIIGGKFLERTRVMKPGANMQSPQYYEPHDLWIGGIVEAFSHRFLLLSADEYVLAFMEAQPEKFPQANISLITQKAKEARGLDVFIKRAQESDPKNEGLITPEQLKIAARAAWGTTLNDHEIISLSRHFNKENKVLYKPIIDAVRLP